MGKSLFGMLLLCLFLFGCGEQNTAGGQENAALQPVAEASLPEQAREKEVIVLSYAWAYPELEEMIADFNKSSEEYWVELETGENSADYFQTRGTQIMAGGGPDIFSVVGQTDFSHYVERGVLEDLRPYVERDLQEEDYLQNALFAYEREGHIYALESSFVLTGYVGSSKVLAGVSEWDFEGLLAVLEANPQIKAFAPDYDSMEVLRTLCLFGAADMSDTALLKKYILFAEKYGNGPSMEEAVLGENVLLVPM